MLSTRVALLSLTLFVAADAAAQTSWVWGHDDLLVDCTSPVVAGLTHNFTFAYVARVHKGKNVIPGFADLDEIKGAVAYSTPQKPIITNTYEVLCGSGVAWQPSAADLPLPANAVPVGELNGQPLYSCRASVEGPDGNFVSGVVDPETMHCNITVSKPDKTYSSSAHKQAYDVLVEIKPKSPSKVPSPQYDWYWASESYSPCPNDSIETGLAYAKKGKERIAVRPSRTHSLDQLYPGYEVSKKNYYAYQQSGYGYVGSGSTYEVLCGSGFAWLPMNLTQGAQIPSGAVVVGNYGVSNLYACLAIIPGENGLAAIGQLDSFYKYCEVATYEDGAYAKYNNTKYYQILINV